MHEPQSTPEPGKSERLIHSGRKFDVVAAGTTTRSGRPVERVYIRHPGAVVVLAVDPDGRVPFVRQHRAAIGAAVLELPAGTLEPGEDPVRCAARELEEETGLRAATVLALGRFYTSPGLASELMHAFVARGLTDVGQSQEDDEDIAVVYRAWDELATMIGSGELADGKSIAAIALGRAAGVLPWTGEDPA